VSSEFPAEQQWKTRLAELRGSIVVPWSGTTYRFASREFSDRRHFTDGEGARRNGGRFTAIGAQRTLYLSLDRATATAELDSWFAYYNVPDTAFQPRVLAAVAVIVRRVIDLTLETTRAELGLDADWLAGEWRPISDTGGVAPTQVFGRLVWEAGFEGVLFPSARHPQGANLALFPDNFLGESDASMLNPG
jgi:RES domain-containing protein